jgi:hypothetical protein
MGLRSGEDSFVPTYAAQTNASLESLLAISMIFHLHSKFEELAKVVQLIYNNRQNLIKSFGAPRAIQKVAFSPRAQEPKKALVQTRQEQNRLGCINIFVQKCTHMLQNQRHALPRAMIGYIRQ